MIVEGFGGLACGGEHDVEPAFAACLLNHIDGLMEPDHGGVDVPLANASEGQVAKRDGGGLLAVA